MGRQLSRRAALKAGIATAAAAGIGGLRNLYAQDDDDFNPGGRVRVDYDETISFNELYDFPPMLGRVEAWSLRVLTEATNKSDFVKYAKYDEVLPIYRAVRGEAPGALPHNDIWFELGEGYIHSSNVVPVHEDFQEPEDVIGKGFWGEITVPTSWQHFIPKLRSKRYYDLAYGCVFWVSDRADEIDGRAWYRIVDDTHPGVEWWVMATHVRRILRKEFAPISPDVPPEDKLIVVDIGQQLLTCYEDGVVVFATRIASGTSFRDKEGKPHFFHTPYGTHRVLRMTPSRHMSGSNPELNDAFDLPGVPWCTFFTEGGSAIHGTYWHNDFGRKRSHGCVNVTNDAAKWIYRWVNPHAGYNDDLRVTTREEYDTATQIIVE